MELIDTLCKVAMENGAEARLRIKSELLEIEDTIFTDDDMTSFLDRCGYADVPNKGREVDLAWENTAGQRFRVNIYESMGSRSAVLRPLRKVTHTIDDLGLPVERLQNWFSRRSGLVLFTGATGSGKSTSLAACINWVIKSFKKHVVTIEDPVEYMLDSDQ